MFERYTEKARRVIFFARCEASQLGGMAIEAEHLLLGLLREDRELTQGLFADADSSCRWIRGEIERRAGSSPRVGASVDMPLSPGAKQVLVRAADESERLRDRHIGTEHLMLGLLKEERSFASEILRDLGVTADKVAACLPAKQPEPDTTESSKATPADLLEQLRRLVDRLAHKGLLAQDEFNEQLFAKSAALHLQIGLNLLLNLLVGKGVISEEERREISTGQSGTA